MTQHDIIRCGRPGANIDKKKGRVLVFKTRVLKCDAITKLGILF